MRSLVLARVGRRSLHQCWVDPGRERDWDLYLSPYEPIPPQAGCDCTVGEVIPGPKLAGLRTLLQRWDGWRDYDFVWLPDDDIYASQDSISRMFGIVRGVGLDLFAPALHESSHFAHFSTMRNASFFGRWVGFVEIMMPGFSAGALQELAPTIDLSATGWGWGLDSVWPKLLGYENVGIVDGVPVVHTRPVGSMRDADLAARVHRESDALLARFGCRQEHVTFGAFGPDLAPLDLSPEQLLADLVEGYRYLIAKDPRVLAWIMAYQQAHADWPGYPTEGTPADPPAAAEPLLLAGTRA
jgi:hypothetical protein